MKFGIHNPSWLFGTEPDGIFDAVKAKAHSVIRRADGGEEVIPSKAATTLRKGDRLVIETAGGGGYGDPLERSAAEVREDVRNGKVSEEAARSVYGQARQR